MRRRKGLATGDVLILGDSIYLLASNGLPWIVQKSANVGQERLTGNRYRRLRGIVRQLPMSVNLSKGNLHPGGIE